MALELGGGLRRGEWRARATECLVAVGMESFGRRLPSELSGGEQQRVAIARVDLHDGIKQELLATSMQLAAARASLPPDTDPTATALEQAHASCRGAQHELAALLDQLPAPPLTRTNLKAALTELSDRLARESGVRVVQDIGPEPRLSEAAEAALYRVAQEALTNVSRHADATTVTLTLSGDRDETHLQIHDDGHGFRPDQPATGIGLQTMRERVEALDGRFAVESGAAGTTVDAILPTRAG